MSIDRPVCYTCVTDGYDAVAPVSPDWRARFVLFHDGSVSVPAGWEGVRLDVPGVEGVDLNRYAKMLPHRLALGSSRSLYVDGNMFFRNDPADRIDEVTSRDRVAAMAHPDRDCGYREIRRTLELGFVWPVPARRAIALLRRSGVPAHAGLFECGILFRQHDDPAVMSLGEAWWRAWRLGYRRDQALMIAAAHATGVMPASLGLNDVRDPANRLMGMVPHRVHRSRGERLPRRLASEAMVFRAWARP